MQPLGSLGGPNSDAAAINNSGIIVGDSDIAGSSGPSHAFVFDGAMHDLNDLLTSPIDVPLNLATAINNEGQILALAGTPSGGERGFLLTPVPEPAAISVVGGLAALLWRRRTRI